MRTRTLKLLGMYVVLGILLGLSVTKILPSILAMPLILAVLIFMLVFVVAPYVPPSWANRVTKDGKKAQATVLANDFVKAGGADLWVAVPVEVCPEGIPAFKANMRCKTSQASRLAVGTTVSVYCDPQKKLALMA